MAIGGHVRFNSVLLFPAIDFFFQFYSFQCFDRFEIHSWLTRLFVNWKNRLTSSANRTVMKMYDVLRYHFRFGNRRVKHMFEN